MPMRRMSSLLAAALIVLGSATSSVGVGAAGGAQQKAKPIPTSPESIKAGMKIYADRCRACHGLRAKGDGIAAPPGTKPADLTDAEWKHGSTDAQIFENIKEGIRPFEAMKPQKVNMTDADIWNVINYVRSLAKPAK
jgi:mono/diheme cytochrome c family protein